MQKITERGLKKHLGKSVIIEREGVIGNALNEKGKPREGQLLGILFKNEFGFYVNMFKSSRQPGETIVYDYASFLEEPYKVQDRDLIRVNSKTGFGKYVVRIDEI